MKRRNGPIRLALLIGGAMLAAGCAGPRRAANYSTRAPELHTVAILPVAVEAHSVHAGGMLERRPDLEPELQAQMCAALKGELEQRGRRCRVLPTPGQSREDADALALLRGVCAGILEHHYTSGHAVQIDYSVGQAIHAWDTAGSDAVLCVYLENVQPTGGRGIMLGAALAVSIATRVPILIDFRNSVLLLMLIDSHNGEVLWFNQQRSVLPVLDSSDLRSFVADAADQLLVRR